MTNKPTFS